MVQTFAVSTRIPVVLATTFLGCLSDPKNSYVGFVTTTVLGFCVCLVSVLPDCIVHGDSFP